MANQLWLDRLRAELARRRLPPAYAERLIGELLDHWDDLKEDKMSLTTEREVGDPVYLAEAAESTYRRGILWRRHLMATAVFLLAPVLVQLASWVAVLFAVGSAFEWIAKGLVVAPGNVLNATLVHGFMALVVICSTVALMACVDRFAHRTGSNRHWPWASVLLMSAVAGLTFHFVELLPKPGLSSITLGFGPAFTDHGISINFDWWQVLQFSLSLAFGLFILIRTRRQPTLLGPVARSRLLIEQP